MNKLTLEIIQGSELSNSYIDFIDHHRSKEFSAAALREEDSFKSHIFFFLKEGRELVAFGRLIPTQIILEGKTYEILGIASIVAVYRHKGYGRELMKHIKDYISDIGKTAFGFCNPDVSEFYKKCGYDIIENGGERFIHKESGQSFSAEKPKYALYINGKDGAGDAIAHDDHGIVYTVRNRW